MTSENVSRETSGLLHCTQTDGCCGRELNRAAMRGALDSVQLFTCPKCGSEFKRKEFGPFVRWDCVADFAVV